MIPSSLPNLRSGSLSTVSCAASEASDSYFGQLPCNHNVAPSPFTPQSHVTQPTAATEASGSDRGSQSSAHSFPVSFTSQGVAYQELHQTPYDRGLTSEVCLLPEMLFGGINLGEALRHNFSGLEDQDRGAWPASGNFNVPQKLAVVFCFSGYDKYSRQVNVLRRVRSRAHPKTRSELAEIIAAEMNTFLRLACEAGKPLSHCGRELGLDDLVLVNIQHKTRGSLQPTIGVVVHSPDATILR
ncbi:hypothetical protein L227DRAFT_568097 [Lentinus tigrinus ALCF2SS1-6]|uniref:Uncharacterized protein n=1 Tax=Lentinus tigrinus ALCF2SS1-6 TaxID=1328759 RepID=A0A5C2RSN1_9APHY|nr:hypothetical protein L227DRAFT_568097 [Lentinus tigrinus ALCF2SS1-6]